MQKGYTPFAEGDILWAKITPCMQNGKTCIVRGLTNKVGFGSTEFHVLRVLAEDILKEFVWEFISQDSLRRAATYAFTGSAGHQRVPETFLAALPFPKLSYEKQIQLVTHMNSSRLAKQAKLAEADSLMTGLDGFLLKTLGIDFPPKEKRGVFAIKRSLLNRRVDAYSNQPHFRAFFEALYNSKYKVVSLKKVAERIFSGSTPLAKSEAYVEPPLGVRFIRSGEITPDGGVAHNSEVHISDVIHESVLKGSQLERGDLLIAIVGATIGAVGVYDRIEPANINQAIAAVRLKANSIKPDYVCWYMHSSIGQQILDYFKRPVAPANINLEEVGDIPLHIPPIELQNEIVDEVNRRRKEAQQLHLEAETEWKAAKLWFEEQLLGG
ncbi:hypothetical protein SDC9_94778 [bioreactor metagenome]|uniref:Type I restriction modification DNA specificity domain-containing protein n=1 Tax=bioreactor metagenome TaxID=1076179 RepID=A0A645A541_9ZZZZ